MDFPNFRHLRVFVSTLRHGSVSAAADVEHLTQPAASQGIAKLEAELGAKLLVRTGRQIVSTPEGALYVERARRALGFLEAGATTIQKPSTAGLAHKMTASQVRALIAVADAGSFTIGAKVLGLAQPSVHRRARMLEALAGVALFRAAATGVTLTAAGHTLTQAAKLARAELRQGREEIAALAGQGAGTFVLGSLPLARSKVVPHALDRVLQHGSDVQVHVVDGRYTELLRDLREGEIDVLIGALRDPAPADDVMQEPLFSDELVVVCRAAHPLAKSKNLSLEDTAGYSWIAPPKTTPTGTFLFEMLEISGRDRTPVRVVSSSLVLVRRLLLLGDYVSILSRQQVEQDISEGRLAVLPVALPEISRPIGLTLRKNWHPTAAQNTILDHLRHATRLAAAEESI